MPLSSRRHLVLCAALTAAALLPVSACSGDSSAGATTSAPSTTVVPPTMASPFTVAPTPTPKPTPAALTVNPLTGLAPVPKGPVIAVKVDDTPSGRPQIGVDKADLIYIEAAEGSATRVCAIFATNKPTVGPVRSLRPSDPEILEAYGPIGFVATGGGGSGPRVVRKSQLVALLENKAPGFRRLSTRKMPYNAVVRLSAYDDLEAAGVRPVGFAWNPQDERAVEPARTITKRVGLATVTFRWNEAAKSYVRTSGGSSIRAAGGALMAKPNVVVMHVDITDDYADRDVNGAPSQYTHLLGSGKVEFFRDGKRMVGTWERHDRKGPMFFLDANRRTMTLSPGGAFVVLANR